jgi:hypothetical protein
MIPHIERLTGRIFGLPDRASFEGVSKRTQGVHQPAIGLRGMPPEPEACPGTAIIRIREASCPQSVPSLPFALLFGAGGKTVPSR